ncbi:MAG: cytochrome c oxidase assembly protein [Thaumarchaeota archaeon]|nr:cytochrome c oxidase assembly protein [Nitrososphaerota archaeon]
MHRLALPILLAVLLGVSSLSVAYGHTEGGSAQRRIVGDYQIGFETFPPIPTFGSNITLIFSVSELSGNHVSNITASVTVVGEGDMIQRYPEQFYRSGDFSARHVFDSEGRYTVVLEIRPEPPLKAEFEVNVYSESILLLVNYGGFAVLGVVLAAIGFFYVKSRGKIKSSAKKTLEELFTGPGISRLFYVRSLPLLLIGASLVLLMGSPWAERLEQENLAFHMMAQHLGFASGTVLMMFGGEHLVLGLISSFRGLYPSRLIASFYARVISLNHRLNSNGRVFVPAVTVLLAYWHIPENFNAAVVDEGVHVLMHLSFMLIGAMVFFCIKVLSIGQILVYTAILGQAMMIGGVILISTPVHLYPSYPLQQQLDAGLVMVAPHPFMLAIIGVYAFSHYFWKN